MTVKDTVLKALQENTSEEGFVSGEELAEKTGVTRASVWKAVTSLREAGCNIEAVSNKGYRLIADNIFDQKTVSGFLDRSLNVKLIFLDSTDSTNNEAKRLLASSAYRKLSRTVIASSEQTAGKGRLGRKFYSPKNTGIYLSLIYSEGEITDPAVITASAAVAVCRAIKKTFGIDTSIKWVNDIYLKNKKISGILTEGITDFESGRIEACVIGIGINITMNEDCPTTIVKSAGGILKDMPASKRSILCAETINQLLYILTGNEEAKKASMEEYKSRSNIIGKTVTVTPLSSATDSSYDCQVLDITEDAKLRILTQKGETKFLSSGEITLHRQ